MPILALTGTTGKIGGAVLDALLSYDLIKPSDLVICTSSDANDARWDSLKQKGASIRYATYDDPKSMEKAFEGCERLFLVSTPRIAMDFFYAPPGQGREKHHISAIEAARVAGVKHIYYTSLGFGDDSIATVMFAHNRTEAYLERSWPKENFTALREGLYNESWPLYMGHYDPKGDDRKEIVVPGDGQIDFTAIKDLGLANALILTADTKKYAGQKVVLSAPRGYTIQDVADIVSKYKGYGIKTKIVPKKESIEHYIKERGMDEGYVRWWAQSAEGVPAGETRKNDNTLVDLLKEKGRTPIPLEDTIKQTYSS